MYSVGPMFLGMFLVFFPRTCSGRWFKPFTIFFPSCKLPCSFLYTEPRILCPTPALFSSNDSKLKAVTHTLMENPLCVSYERCQWAEEERNCRIIEGEPLWHLSSAFIFPRYHPASSLCVPPLLCTIWVHRWHLSVRPADKYHDSYFILFLVLEKA